MSRKGGSNGWHNGENGPMPCNASTGACPVTKVTGEQHYESEEAALVAYDKNMADTYDTIPKFEKKARISGRNEKRPSIADKMKRVLKNPQAQKAVAALTLAAIAAGGAVAYNAATQGEMECKVTGVETVTIVKDKSSNQEKRILTEDCGILKVENDLFSGSLGSNEIYSSLKAGETYHFETTGLNVQWASMFPNVTSATQITSVNAG